MSSQPLTKPVPLEPSQLGTKEYWDKLYISELSNNVSNPSDVGTIWFDDSSAEDKILAFLHSPEFGLDLDTTSFLDLGTGNGHFLFRLRERWPADIDSEEDVDDKEDNKGRDIARETGGTGITQQDKDGMSSDGDFDRDITESNEMEKRKHKQRSREAGGFKGPMVGADYSLPSITFARKLASSRGYGTSSTTHPSQPIISFIHHDILHSPTTALLSPLGSASFPSTTTPTSHSPSNPEQNQDQDQGYDVILDKGTFDAISLSSFPSTSILTSPSSPNPTQHPRIEDIYAAKILPLLKKGGLFIITSCNWTSGEIRSWFDGEGEGAGEGAGEGEAEEDAEGGRVEHEVEGGARGTGRGEGRVKRRFEYVDEVKYPTFSFGGQRGQTVCTLCFRRVK